MKRIAACGRAKGREGGDERETRDVVGGMWKLAFEFFQGEPQTEIPSGLPISREEYTAFPVPRHHHVADGSAPVRASPSPAKFFHSDLSDLYEICMERCLVFRTAATCLPRERGEDTSVVSESRDLARIRIPYKLIPWLILWTIRPNLPTIGDTRAYKGESR